MLLQLCPGQPGITTTLPLQLPISCLLDTQPNLLTALPGDTVANSAAAKAGTCTCISIRSSSGPDNFPHSGQFAPAYIGTGRKHAPDNHKGMGSWRQPAENLPESRLAC
jgi:hypothetical protein